MYILLKMYFVIILVSLYALEMNRFNCKSTQQSQGAIFLGNNVNTIYQQSV